MNNFYSFSAIRGTQAGYPYFTVMIPLGQVPRIFSFDDETLPPDLRAQRVLSKARVPQIAEYLFTNWDNYILSSLCASVDGELSFRSASDDLGLRNVGILTVSMDARILINDGQHRRAAIEEALKIRPELENETISVVLFADRGLERSQQMFADLNKNAVRPSGSLNVLFDRRSPLSQLSSGILNKIEFFRRFTDLERSSIPNRGTALYTLSSLNRANEWLAGKDANRFGESTVDLAVEYWSALFDVMLDWQRLDAGTLKSCDLRQGTVHAHGVLLQALGLLGGRLLAEKPKDWRTHVRKLESVDWSRRNADLWEGRVMNGARMNGQKRAVQLGANVLCTAVELPLDERGRHAENSFLEMEAA
ncbi:DNA sulfur modification protein DndB [Rhizobium sp. L1K21]|uniref:DNA sulfur modification protein DndB n=1 Tax=Rhizobium sp. L1K21 TaxID=2954933 RepID=UPI0020939398|nr:DNA sulfur modification protein DndB [Rhizobium sp. L1K21]MCO6185208.1 DNA sulfur modification protein DndB [Rhizobium sp. L1K21]